ncbi:gliding motility-associated C-terminal domain-containing protein [Hymenobacter sp. BT175]|nr:gliding motility-associated C-terminal domain-containing protein [Hymenobacter translucens]
MYSRWGQRVFYRADYHNDWDAKGLPEGAYYYLLKTSDGRAAKGWMQVKP